MTSFWLSYGFLLGALSSCSEFFFAGLFEWPSHVPDTALTTFGNSIFLLFAGKATTSELEDLDGVLAEGDVAQPLDPLSGEQLHADSFRSSRL